jgi:hypothetical protein
MTDQSTTPADRPADDTKGHPRMGQDARDDATPADDTTGHVYVDSESHEHRDLR